MIIKLQRPKREAALGERKRRDLFKTTRVPMTPCPDCGKALDAASSTKGETPDPGDATVCLYCGAVLLFTQDMTLRRATSADFADMPLEAQE